MKISSNSKKEGKEIESFFNRQGDIRIPNKIKISHQYYLEMSKIYLFKGEY